MKPIIFENKEELNCLSNFTQSMTNPFFLCNKQDSIYLFRQLDLQLELLDRRHPKRVQRSVGVVLGNGTDSPDLKSLVEFQPTRQQKRRRRLSQYETFSEQHRNRSFR